jgi:dienelactone hydrolase
MAGRGRGHGLAGAVGFYGRPGEAADGSPGPQQLASRINAPVLALQAGRGSEHHRRPERGVRAGALGRRGRARARRLRGRAAQLSSTASRRSSRARRRDAWSRTLEFVERHSQ